MMLPLLALVSAFTGPAAPSRTRRHTAWSDVTDPTTGFSWQRGTAGEYEATGDCVELARVRYRVDEARTATTLGPGRLAEEPLGVFVVATVAIAATSRRPAEFRFDSLIFTASDGTRITPDVDATLLTDHPLVFADRRPLSVGRGEVVFDVPRHLAAGGQLTLRDRAHGTEVHLDLDL